MVEILDIRQGETRELNSDLEVKRYKRAYAKKFPNAPPVRSSNSVIYRPNEKKAKKGEKAIMPKKKRRKRTAKPKRSNYGFNWG
jgi:hypothetical protein